MAVAVGVGEGVGVGVGEGVIGEGVGLEQGTKDATSISSRRHPMLSM